MQTKKCNKCLETFSIENFYIRKSGKIYSICKKCACIVASQWSKDNKEKANAKNRNQRVRNKANRPEVLLYRGCRDRAIANGMPFDITPEDIKIPEVCPVLGIPLFASTGKPTDNSPSVDKRIPSLGYVRGNIEVISFRANKIKSDATPEELLKVANYYNR